MLLADGDDLSYYIADKYSWEDGESSLFPLGRRGSTLISSSSPWFFLLSSMGLSFSFKLRVLLLSFGDWSSSSVSSFFRFLMSWEWGIDFFILYLTGINFSSASSSSSSWLRGIMVLNLSALMRGVFIPFSNLDYLWVVSIECSFSLSFAFCRVNDLILNLLVVYLLPSFVYRWVLRKNPNPV